jgi:hypothetical protein
MKIFALLCVLVVALASNTQAKDLYKKSHKPNILLKGVSKATNQYTDIYDYTHQGGTRVRLTDYTTSLRNLNFDNRVSSLCVTGIWLLYADENYNVNNVGGSNYWVYGDNYCTDVPSQFENQASSARFTGAPDAWKADTLNLYLNEYFIGGEEYTYVDVSNLKYNDQAKSVVVTGCSPWTLYESSNYYGRCMCVYPSSTSSCNPGFYTTESSLGTVARTISSARKGCYCNSKVYPDNYESAEQQGFF